MTEPWNLALRDPADLGLDWREHENLGRLCGDYTRKFHFAYSREFSFHENVIVAEVERQDALAAISAQVSHTKTRRGVQLPVFRTGCVPIPSAIVHTRPTDTAPFRKLSFGTDSPRNRRLATALPRIAIRREAGIPKLDPLGRTGR